MTGHQVLAILLFPTVHPNRHFLRITVANKLDDVLTILTFKSSRVLKAIGIHPQLESPAVAQCVELSDAFLLD